MSKKTLIFLSIITVIVLVGVLWYAQAHAPVKPDSAGSPLAAAAGDEVPLTTGPKRSGSTSGQNKFSVARFTAPAPLTTSYIYGQVWPPQVRVLQTDLVCGDNGSDTGPAGDGKTVQRKIGSDSYCLTTRNEGAMSHTYTNYTYAIQRGGRTIVVKFTLSAVACSVYDGPKMSACKKEQASFNSDAAVPAIVTSVTWSDYRWEFLPWEAQADGIPKTSVQLWAGDKPYEIGAYTGSCARQENDFLPNEQEKVICWYAGGGKEIGVFTENGKTVVKVGDLDEGDSESASGESTESSPVRANFRTVLAL